MNGGTFVYLQSRAGCGLLIWGKPKRAIRSQHVDDVEIKCLGSYVVAPPSPYPNGSVYTFEVAPNGLLTEENLEELLGLGLIK